MSSQIDKMSSVVPNACMFILYIRSRTNPRFVNEKVLKTGHKCHEQCCL